MRQRRPLSEDRGASVVEFAMLSVLLVLLLFAVLQIALWFYARTVVSAAAADAARYAATASTPDAGAQRARQLIDSGLSPVVAAHIPCTASATVDQASGLPTRTVHCRGRLAVTFLPFDLPLPIDARSSALVEGAG